MDKHKRLYRRLLIAAISVAAVAGVAAPANAQPGAAQSTYAQVAYRPITPTMEAQTIVLDGTRLTVEQVIAVARHGAKVSYGPGAIARMAEAHGILLQGAAEGVQIYRFNRGAGAQREVVLFTGDPTTPENRAIIELRQYNAFARGFRAGYGPEVSEEAAVRAQMVVRANTLTYTASTPQMAQMLIDLLNHRITPVVRSRGTVGEGDLAQISNVKATMVGQGDVWYRGVRMTAAQALQQAGLTPIRPFGSDEAALDVTNAWSAGLSALLVEEGRQALEWAELAYVIDLNGLNSSVTPMSFPVQAERPIPWLNWQSRRFLDMIRGSYLFGEDRKRIIQDPESMRATPHRTAAAWKAWAELREAVQDQINASEQNPVIRAIDPGASWELSTPHFMTYHVKGGPLSNGKSGYILSNANWDPYPLSNEVEGFSNALVNLDVAIGQRLYRFSSTFFTVQAAGEILSPAVMGQAPAQGGGFVAASIWQEIANLTRPIHPEGNAIVQNVEDLQANTNLKVSNAREAVDRTFHLIGQDLLVGTYWMEVRKQENASRQFGPTPTAALAALRQVVPWQMNPDQRPAQPLGEVVYGFMKRTPAATFYRGEHSVPATREPATTSGR